MNLTEALFEVSNRLKIIDPNIISRLEKSSSEEQNYSFALLVKRYREFPYGIQEILLKDFIRLSSEDFNKKYQGL